MALAHLTLGIIILTLDVLCLGEELVNRSLREQSVILHHNIGKERNIRVMR